MIRKVIPCVLVLALLLPQTCEARYFMTDDGSVVRSAGPIVSLFQNARSLRPFAAMRARIAARHVARQAAVTGSIRVNTPAACAPAACTPASPMDNWLPTVPPPKVPAPVDDRPIAETVPMPKLPPWACLSTDRVPAPRTFQIACLN